jgi:hypothetical protein
MRTLLTLALLAAAPLARAAEEAIVQEAEGEAAIVGGDKSLAKERAIDDALRRAVEMAVGTMVSAETVTENFQLVSDKILSQAKGYVKTYEKLSESEDGGAIKVKVRATVGAAAIDKDLEGIAHLLSQKNRPRVMIMIAEQNLGQSSPAAWWAPGGGGQAPGQTIGIQLRLVENTLIDEMGKVGFNFVDHETLAGKIKTMAVATTPNDSQVREIGNLGEAQVVIVGQAIAVKAGDLGAMMGGEGPGMKSCKGTVSARAINTDNGDIIATAETSKNALHIEELTCGKQALSAAAKDFAAKLQNKIILQWLKESSTGGRVRLRVAGVDSFTTLQNLKSGLASAVRGVKGVNQRKWEGGTAELDVTYVGNSEQMASELEGKPLGKVKVRVKNMSANSLDLEIVGGK